MNDGKTPTIKGRFYIPTKLYESLLELNDAERGELFMACFNYHVKGVKTPRIQDKTLRVIWSGILLPFFVSCDIEYNKVCERNRNNGLKALEKRAK